MDLAPRRLRRDDVREERQKVGARVPRGGLPDHLAGLSVQRGVEREGAVPLVFEAVALRSAGRQREARVDAVERLNRRLFVETEHRGVLRRRQVQAEHVGGFRLKVGIGRPHVSLDPMGLQPGALPRALHKGVTAELQRRRQRPRAPLRAPFAGGFRVQARMRASKAGVSTVGVFPRYRPAKPATRPSRNRCFHLAIVRELSPRRIKSAYEAPSAKRTMMRARFARSARPRLARMIAANASRSSGVNSIVTVECGMRHTIIYKCLVHATSEGHRSYTPPRLSFS